MEREAPSGGDDFCLSFLLGETEKQRGKDSSADRLCFSLFCFL
jgi:hypothetical protein